MGFYRNTPGGEEIPTSHQTVIIVDADSVPSTGGGGGGGGLSAAQTTAAVQTALQQASTLDQLESLMLSDPDFNSDIVRDFDGTPFRLLRTDSQGGTAVITYETLAQPPAAYTPIGAPVQWSSFAGGTMLS